MTARLRQTHRAQGGITIIELLVALAVFAMFILLIDALFFSANRSVRKAELAADVQQNARIAVERITRELRQSQWTQVVVDTSGGLGRHAILMKSARLRVLPSVFCLYVRDADDPLVMRGTGPGSAEARWACFRSFGGANNVPDPEFTPYTGPPYPLCAPNTDPTVLHPCGSYTPMWQQYIGYYVAENPPASGRFELRRVSGQLSRPDESLTTTMLAGPDWGVIASYVDGFDVAWVDQVGGRHYTITLEAEGTEVVQGSDVPAQQVKLPGGTLPRD